jgi:hypothetical protein
VVTLFDYWRGRRVGLVRRFRKPLCSHRNPGFESLPLRQKFYMPIDENLNTILKEMWRLDNKLMKKESLELSETRFYNEHLEIIQSYYWENNIHWKEKKRIEG